MSVSYFNPFAELQQEFLDVVLHNRKQKREAEQQYEALLTAYRTLLGDARYAPIRQEVFKAAGRQTTALIAAAAKCRCGCAPLAERIRLLLEVLACPIESVFNAEIQERLQSEAEEGETD